MKRLATLSLLGSLCATTVAQAQEPPPPAGEPPPPANPTSTATPPPAAPANTAPAPATPPPGNAGASMNAGASYSLGDGLEGGASTSSSAEVGDSGDDREWRRWSLKLQNNLRSSTGLLHTSEAGSGAAGTFRISLISEYFTGTGLLCDGTDCPAPPGQTNQQEDEVTRIGAHVGISATPLPFLEAYVGFHASAVDNDQGRPQLLQVLGDTNLGLKGFLPRKPGGIFSFGGEVGLWLLNGTGSVGLDGAGTSFSLGLLGSLDLNNQLDPADAIPLKAHLNLGYRFDNSGKLVEDVEKRRKNRITRIERFGLNIDRTDAFQIGLGLEGTFKYIHPFAEYSIDVPVNRQDYVCNESRVYPNDGCLGNDSGFSTTPSRVTVGARGYPGVDGLSLLLALDIGTGATSSFIEEVSPELPWNLYVGVGFAADVTPPEPIVREVQVERVVPAPVVESYIQGTVVEKGTANPVAGAIVVYEGRSENGMVTTPTGAFRTINLQPGTYTFGVSAKGYKPGTCSATLTAAGASPPGPYYGSPGTPPGPYTPPSAGTGQGSIANVKCELESLPKVGNIQGSLIDAASSNPVAGAKVKIMDKLGRELELKADAGGAFRFENVPPGTATIRVEADGFLPSITKLEVKSQQDVKAAISLNKLPKKPNVVVRGAELKLRKKVHFAHDSANIEPDSAALIAEIASVLKKKKEIATLEIQGHTDNTGSPVYNQRLSQQRAEAVRQALIAHGIQSSRLTAKGYGQEKPLLPNVSAANRARNRRVQLIITKKSKK